MLSLFVCFRVFFFCLSCATSTALIFLSKRTFFFCQFVGCFLTCFWLVTYFLAHDRQSERDWVTNKLDIKSTSDMVERRGKKSFWKALFTFRKITVSFFILLIQFIEEEGIFGLFYCVAEFLRARDKYGQHIAICIALLI